MATKKKEEESSPKFEIIETVKVIKFQGKVYTPEELKNDEAAFKTLCDHLVKTGSSSIIKEVF